MGRWHLLGILLLCACKAELGAGARDNPDAASPSDGPVLQSDAAVDSVVMLGPWGAPVAVPGANSALAEDDATLSSNKLEMYFKRTDAGPDNNLYMMTRASESAAWTAPVAVTALNTTTANEESPRLSANDLTMYFGRGGEIYKSIRTNTTSPWQAPTIVPTLNTTANEKWADVCDSGYAIVSRAVTGQGQDLIEGTVTAGATTSLTALNSTSNEQGTLLTADCLRIYFQSDRAGTFDIYMSSRATTTSPWSAPTMLPDFNTTTSSEEDPWISTDQRTFVFVTNASGNKDVYISTR
jgi:hypothetical protein